MSPYEYEGKTWPCAALDQDTPPEMLRLLEAKVYGRPLSITAADRSRHLSAHAETCSDLLAGTGLCATCQKLADVPPGAPGECPPVTGGIDACQRVWLDGFVAVLRVRDPLNFEHQVAQRLLDELQALVE